MVLGHKKKPMLYVQFFPVQKLYVQIGHIIYEPAAEAEGSKSRISKMARSNFLIFRKLPPVPPPLTFFRVLGACWEPHKSRDRTILHRSYTPKKISALTKNIFSGSIKIIFGFFRAFLGFSKGFWIKSLCFIRKPLLKPTIPKSFQFFLSSKKMFFRS